MKGETGVLVSYGLISEKKFIFTLYHHIIIII